MVSPDNLVLVGRLAGAFGVNGEVRLKSFCAQPEAIAAYAPLTDGGGRSFPRLRLTGQAKGAFTARVDGIATKEEADALKGTDLFVSRDRFPDPDEDEFYVSDLIGMTVVDTGGAVLGVVKSVDDFGAGDIVEITRAGHDSLLIPFTKATFPTVDLSTGRLVADPPEGSL